NRCPTRDTDTGRADRCSFGRRSLVLRGVVARVHEPDVAESFFQPAIQTVTSTLEQFIQQRVRQRLEPVRVANGLPGGGVPQIGKVAVLEALKAMIRHERRPVSSVGFGFESLPLR